MVIGDGIVTMTTNSDGNCTDDKDDRKLEFSNLIISTMTIIVESIISMIRIIVESIINMMTIMVESIISMTRIITKKIPCPPFQKLSSAPSTTPSSPGRRGNWRETCDVDGDDDDSDAMVWC